MERAHPIGKYHVVRECVRGREWCQKQVNKRGKGDQGLKGLTFGNLGGWRREKEGNGGLLERETGAALEREEEMEPCDVTF